MHFVMLIFFWSRPKDYIQYSTVMNHSNHFYGTLQLRKEKNEVKKDVTNSMRKMRWQFFLIQTWRVVQKEEGKSQK
jgi:hypothetical protein